MLGHMECLVEESHQVDGDSQDQITFLYTLGEGTCPKSFGINVARLAGLPEDVLAKAKRISSDFENEMSSAERSRTSLVTGSNAVAYKQKITEAIEAGNWDEVNSLWHSLQEL
jgi:DNA mismatch repair ATPase MutS